MMFSLDLDVVIFAGFLVVNLALGLFYARGVQTTEEYAIGNRKFSTSAITATIISTCVGGGLFSTALAESYREGLYFIIPVICGDLISLLITGYFLIPRMVEFLGTLSVAEAMGKLYGKYVRVATAISGVFLATGIVALQFKVASNVMELFFGVSGFYATLMSAIVVILYSAFGGIKAVTFTDILQFAVFGIVIPVICITIWQETPVNIREVFDGLSGNPLFNYKDILGANNPRLLSFMFLVLVFIIPGLDPAFFQRVSMSSGTLQAQKSFISAALIIAFTTIVVCWTAVLILSNNSGLDPDKLLPHIINTYTSPGLKGMVAIGIMATIMSTADSYINVATVMLEHDIIRVLYRPSSSNQKTTGGAEGEEGTLLLKITALFVGIAALYISYDTGTMQQIFLKMLSFYMPIVSVPLLLAIFDFRSSSKVVLMGMASGALTVIIWPYLYNSDDVVIPAMLANAVIFFIMHNVYGRPKGSGSSEYYATLDNLRQKRSYNLHSFIIAVKTFSAVAFCKKNFPKHESLVVAVGLFSVITTFSTLHFTPHQTQNYYASIYQFIYYSTLISSFVMIIYPIWSQKLKSLNIMPIFFIIASSYAFVFAPMLLVIVSKFMQLQIVIFLINLLAFTYFMQWHVVLASLILSVLGNIKFYNFYIESAATAAVANNHEAYVYYDNIGWEFKITYVLLLSSAALMAFLKPKQEAWDLSEKMVDHLTHAVEDQDNQIYELSNVRQVFLRNVQHETNTPVTGIYSMSQALQDCYDKLTDEQHKNAIATIVTSAERLISYVNNLIGISKLTSFSYKLNMKRVNLSNLLEETLRKCQRLYIPKDAEEDRVFEVKAESHLTAKCDEYYMRKSFENIIINAIQFCKKGKISIFLNNVKGQVIFKVKDTGIGVPQEDLNRIFDPFVTSSKTTTPAGGRGLGLTLVKAVAEAHGGTITAQSDENPRSACSIFTLNIPSIALHKSERC